MTAEREQQGAADKAQIARAAGLVMALFVVEPGPGPAARDGHQPPVRHRRRPGCLPGCLSPARHPVPDRGRGGAGLGLYPHLCQPTGPQDDEAGAWRLASAVINLVLILTTLLAALAALLAPWLVRTIIAPGFDPARQALTADLMRLDAAHTRDLWRERRGDGHSQRPAALSAAGPGADHVQPGHHRRGGVPGAGHGCIRIGGGRGGRDPGPPAGPDARAGTLRDALHADLGLARSRRARGRAA